MNNPNLPLIRLLIVDDDEDDFVLARDAFNEIKHARYEISWASSWEAGLVEMRKAEHDVCLLDYRLGAKTGLDLLKAAMAEGYRKPVIMLTGLGDHDLDIEAMRTGAADYIVKSDLKPAILERSVRYAISHFATLEKLRAAKEEAEAATRLKDKFLSLVAHDIKGPLSSVTGLLQYVSKDLSAGKTDDLKEFIDLSIQSTKRLYSMVSDLLTIERIQGGKLVLRLSDFDMRDLVESEIGLMIDFADKKKILLKNEVAQDSLVRADIMLMREVLNNLISNAIKFSESGGVVTISMPEKNVIEVRDSGIGIPSDKHKAIFQYHEKTSTFGTAGELGTGLGLPLSYDIIKAHGGEITVKSEVEKGSVFSIHLPG